ncbi:MAG: hypothetical protein PHQ43_01010 [Dehalococcoidales bacterium]|nr:hypothetical protein [Dehalococcoidales bacterium]
MAYSYGHYAIACIVDREKRRALIQSNTYSFTTAGHISGFRSALSHYEVLTVPNVEINPQYPASNKHKHIANLDYFMDQYEEGMEKGKRALYYSDDYGQAALAVRKARGYVSWFCIKSTLPAKYRKFLAIDPASIEALRDAKNEEIALRKARLESPEHRANIAADTERRYSGLIAELKGEIERVSAINSARIAAFDLGEEVRKWRMHETQYIGSLSPDLEYMSLAKYPLPVLKYCGVVESWRNNRPWQYTPFTSSLGIRPLYNKAYLRLSPDRKRIETSKHAQVLTEHAKVIWRIVKNSHDNSTTVCPDIKIDYYTVTKIESGNMTIGCHYIPYEEMEYIAGELGIA